MKGLFNKYLEYRKITIPATVLVAVLLVGGIVWGVYTTTSSAKDNPTVVASNSEEVKSVSAKKDTKKSSTTTKVDQTTSEDKTTSDKKNDTKASATGSVTDTKKDDKKEISKTDSSKKENSSSGNSSNSSANNNQQTPAKPETPAETYDSYNRPMSCSSTFFNTYAGLPAWKENGCVCYYRNGVKVTKSQSDYDKDVLYYNDGWRDCPSCGAEVTFGCFAVDMDVTSAEYGMDYYGCDACRYTEARPHTCKGYCITSGHCILTETE